MNTSYLEMVATSCNGWTCVILSNPCLNICLVPHCKYHGPIGPKKMSSYSDMYTSPGNRQFMNASYLERVTTSCKGQIFGICRISVWSLTMHRIDQLVQKIVEVTQICIPLLLLGSLLIQVILKGSPPNERAGLVLFCRTCVRISVWSLTMHGMDQLVYFFGESTQICIRLLVVGSI